MLDPFIIDGPPSAQAARWKEWVERLETYFAAVALDKEQRRPMLVHLGGAASHKISKSITEEGAPFRYQSLKRALTAYFEPLANLDYKRFLLRQAQQLPRKTLRIGEHLHPAGCGGRDSGPIYKKAVTRLS
ncbi:hypothetical protein NDU88_002679 [Pleurodeles waltl]|uniref:Uncharacterized protein n=1 Tax=Pleurodeles waltl TaxID=8319 RepID=A0AAV7QAL0_PLEWA|nr:hypothetical protein NDU88_002679 [Pleurodeles waltl]